MTALYKLPQLPWSGSKRIWLRSKCSNWTKIYTMQYNKKYNRINMSHENYSESTTTPIEHTPNTVYLIERFQVI